MKINLVKKLIVLGILLLGFWLRFYKVSFIPPGITMDESSIGYNAYSILKTGKDEYGKSFPIVFRSYADYKMPVYFYLTVPFVQLLGLNVLALRFISVVLGLLSGLVIYLFVLKFFGKERWLLACLALTTYTFSPWSIIFSRGAFESNVALFFLLLGIYLQFLAYKNDNVCLLFLSSVTYGVAAYSYHTQRVLALLFLVILPALFYRNHVNRKINRKLILASILIFLFIALPQYLFFKQAAGNTRIKNTVILKPEEVKTAIFNPSKGLLLVERQLSLYFAYFSPRNLFFDPDPVKSRSLPELSTFYSWMVLPYLLGMYLLFSKKDQAKKKPLIFLLLASPVPAALTGDPFATLRALPMIFPLSIVIGLGLEKLFLFPNAARLSRAFFALLLIYSFFSLQRSLFYLLPYEKYHEWNYGYSQLVEEINKFPGTEVLFDDPIGDNYAEFLFFERYPPSKFQKEQNQINLARYYSIANWTNTFKFGRFSVRPIFWEEDVCKKKIIIATPLAVSDGQAREHFFTKAFAIIAPDGKTVFNGYLTNPELKCLDDEKKAKF